LTSFIKKENEFYDLIKSYSTIKNNSNLIYRDNLNTSNTENLIDLTVIITKSLNLLYYIIYLSSDDILIKIFQNLIEEENNFTKKISKIKENLFNLLENFMNIYSNSKIIESIKDNTNLNFNTKNNILNGYHIKRKLLLKGFNAISYFWIRFPDTITTDNSKIIIKDIFNNVKSDDEKLIAIKALTNFFNEIKTRITISQNFTKANNNQNKSKNKFEVVLNITETDKKQRSNNRSRSKDKKIKNYKGEKTNNKLKRKGFDNNNIDSENKKFNEKCLIYNNDPLTENIDLKFDYGVIHLFFENFICEISNFISKEQNIVLRSTSITLLKLIIEQGNINIHSIIPSIFSAIFDINKENRNNSVTILEKCIKNSKDKFFNKLSTSLKISYEFQKNLFVDNNFLNSFVKDFKIKINNKNAKFTKWKNILQEKDNQTENYEIIYFNTDENIFELFLYKINKITKNGNFNFKFLEKIYECFKDIKFLDQKIFQKENLKGLNDHENIKNTKEISYDVPEVLSLVKEFEFYEFLAKLLADFKFIKSSEIIFLVKNLLTDYNMEIQFFNTRYKDFLTKNGINKISQKNENDVNKDKKKNNDMNQIELLEEYTFENKKDSYNINENIENPLNIDLKFLLCILTVSLKTAMIQFLLSKFEFIEKNEEFYNTQIKNGHNYSFHIKLDNSESKTNEDIDLIFPNISISKEMRNYKFYDFYKSFSFFYQELLHIFKNNKKQIKNKKKNNDEEIKSKLEKLIEILKNMKNFYKFKRCQIKSIVNKHRKFLNNMKNNEVENNEFLFNCFFKNIKIHLRAKNSFITECNVNNCDLNKRENKIELNKIRKLEKNDLNKENNNGIEKYFTKINEKDKRILNNNIKCMKIKDEDNLIDLIGFGRKKKISFKNNQNKRISNENILVREIEEIEDNRNFNFRTNVKKKK